jgi:prevent-host-death family protein
MESIGAFEAKTKLASLLDRVERGERLTITKRGRPVAMLVPVAHEQSASTQDIVERMQQLAKGNILGDDMTIREMIEHGRRY